MPQSTILVIGAGPAGLVTAIELARHGAHPIVVERHPATSTFPRATGVSVRSMEIFRGYGIDAAVRRGGWRVIARQATVTRLDDPKPVEEGVGFPDVAAALAVSPETAAVCPQDHLEPVLVEHLRGLGGEVRFSTELIGFTQDASGVDAVIRDRATGVESVVRVAFLVGADGHRSTVRRALGIPMHGPDDLGRFLSVLVRCDLREVLGDRVYGLYVVGGTDGSPTILVPSGSDDRFVVGLPLPPGMDEDAAVAAVPIPRAIAILRAMAGQPDLDVEVLAMGSFAFAAQVAARWREGRVFLVGDAAHRMTPRGGRGMNTAIADGHDLGWKLAWVARGLAGSSLLDTYEAERGPIGRRNVALSMDPNGGGTADGLVEDIGPLGGAVGTRAPHVWIDGTVGPRRSTLDLFGGALVVLSAGTDAAWADDVARVGPDLPIRHVALETAAVAETYGLASGGAVLVRPDGIVAARWPEEPVAIGAALIDAVSGALGVDARSRVRTAA